MFRKDCCISVRRSLTVVELMGKFNHAMLVDHQSAAKLRQFAYQLYNAYALLVLFIKGSSYTDFLCRIYVGNGVFNVFIGKDLLNILSVNSGYARIPFSTAVHSIFQPHMEGTSVVVAQFRVPRIVLAVLCGMGLALAGCVMQTVTGNPLAVPGILGINAGAGFAVMLFLTFFPALHIRTMAYQPIFAIAGGLCTTGLLYLFAKRNGKLLPIYFLLGGIGLASLFSSFMLIMAANMDNSSYQLVARWLAGNIWGTSWHQVLALLPYMLILVPFLLTKSNILDILILGENTAISLGIAVERELRLLLIASVALTSACVAVSGGIGFVGLVAPHMARRLIGGRHHALMPASMLLGALLLLLADTLGRSAFQPREIPVGIVISVLSAPYFLFLLRRYF